MSIVMRNIFIPQRYKLIVDKIADTAKETGFDAYIVGGFVRDLLIKRDPKDLDIMMVSNKSNDKNKLIAGIIFSKFLTNKYKLHDPISFDKFGTSKVFINNEEIEFVIPRKECYSKQSRNPCIQPASLEEDALRRDFTINTLFLRLSDMRILDLTSRGIDDIKNKIIRVNNVQSAEITFQQDPLRILRAVRQSLQLNFTIDSKTYTAMKASVSRINIVSYERIRDEMNKILIEKKPSKAFNMMDEINILIKIFPELAALNTSKRCNHIENLFIKTMKILDKVENNLVLRVSSLLYNIEIYNQHRISNDFTNIKNILKRFTYSNHFEQKVVSIIQNSIRFIMYPSDWNDINVRKFVNECGMEFNLIMKFLKAYSSIDEKYEKFIKLKMKIRYLKSKNMLYIKSEQLNGTEMIKIFNIPAGKWIKEAKNRLKTAYLEKPNMTKEEAVDIVKKMLINEHSN
ncbi:MAG: CCA tRNA nucleotidyltransferase [Endomicrobium sp.]|jgi:tRNA nucleotidyltransferase/poly(A) polymerase|nr:CCA tRNA nucleotidyltransferase [Endomicrobium sp.]